MSTRRSKNVPPVTPVRSLPDEAVSVAPSLPPVPVDGTRSASVLDPTPPPKSYALAKNSLIRKKALAIVALRAAGHSTEEIAKELSITPKSIHQYMWQAGRAGMFKRTDGSSALDNPTDRIEFELTHKAVQNISDMLDSDQILERGEKSVKMEMTREFAKGVLWKKFGETKEGVERTMNALMIKIEIPSTGMNVEREGSVGGTPLSYTNAEIVKADV